MRALLCVCAGFVLLLAAGWWWTLPDRPDGFYDPPADVPAVPGKIVRIAPYANGIPPGARGWRFLYTTTRADGTPAVASAILIAPDAPAAAPRPLVVWAHGTTGIARGCAPSMQPDPLKGVPAGAEVVRHGWAMVATDYVGMGTPGEHAYLVGEDAARAVLDSARAAIGRGEWKLAEGPVIWGHSQGGHSALWAGMRAGAYAPDLHLRGVAALAPASDLVGLVHAKGTTGFGRLIAAYVHQAYGRLYPDIARVPVTPPARLLAAEIGRRCIVDKRALWTVAELYLARGRALLPSPAGNAAMQARLRQNSPDGAIAAPLWVQQGLDDENIDAATQRHFIARRCNAGQRLVFREYPGIGHMGLVEKGSAPVADLLQWTRARLSGESPPSGCIMRRASPVQE